MEPQARRAPGSGTALVLLGLGLGLAGWLVLGFGPEGEEAPPVAVAETNDGPEAPVEEPVELVPIPTDAGPEPERIEVEEADLGGPRVRVRCVRAGTDEPVRDVRVMLRLEGVPRPISRASDDAGRVEMTLPDDPTEAVLFAAPPPAWRVVENLIPIRHDGVLVAETVTIELERLPSAPLRGVVIDEASHKGLPGVTVVLQRGRLKESIETDADGRFASEAEFPEGDVRVDVKLPDDRVAATRTRSLEHVAAEPEEHEVVVALGASFPVTLIGPSNPSQHEWEARIVTRSGDDERTGPKTTLAGTELRATWRRVYAAPEDGFDAFLDIRDKSGLWSGEAPLPSASGYHVEPVVIALSGLAAISGRVVDTTGTPIEDASVALVPAGEGPAPTDPELWSREATDGEGRFRFQRLEPAEYLLRATAGDRPAVDLALTLGPGELDAGDVVVDALEIAGSISGWVESATGRDDVSALVHLASLDGLDVERTLLPRAPPTWTDARSFVRSRRGPKAHFEFEDVPAGRYQITVHSLDGYPYEPDNVTVEAPAEDLAFRRVETAATFGLGFDVRDAGTRAPIERFEATMITDEWWYPGSWTWTSGEVIAEVPETARISWTIFAEGYAPAFGGMEAFHALSGSPRIAEVTLERGWGAELWIREGSEAERTFGEDTIERMLLVSRSTPLVGARAIADGEHVGTSNGDGRVRLRLEKEPEELTIELEGWRAAPSLTFSDGKIQGDTRNALIWMVRE